MDEAVRVSYTESWTSKNGDNLSLTQGDNRAAIINWANGSDWTVVTENGVEYRYYNYKLVPGETTSTLLDSVTFNKDIVNINNCVESKIETGKRIVCSSSGDEYDGATYKLVFTVETVQYDKYKDSWNTNTSIASMKPMNTTALALKSNPITVTNYTDGNIHEMYTFSHEETEQTPALTDYRYIGNDPYNYIYFNCNNLDNQTSETCEVWRIIGVFDVDDGTGYYERRIKLVRGSALPDKMAWDTKQGENFGTAEGKNEWNGSDISIFLNNDYLNKENSATDYGIKESSRNMISNSKFYLGAHELNDYGTAEEVYSWERGTTVCNENGAERSTSWLGKVALMYPSEEFMVYAKGVDDNCYNNSNNCMKNNQLKGDPINGWIYNSNSKDVEDNILRVWFLSPDSGYPTRVFAVDGSGYLSWNTAYGKEGIRPVLYLSSNVKIVDGTGEKKQSI